MENDRYPNKGITIPNDHYETFQQISRSYQTLSRQYRKGWDTRKKLTMVYDRYYHAVRALASWLLDFVGDKPYNVLAFNGRSMVLAPTDNPYDCFWTDTIIQSLSFDLKIGNLYEYFLNNP